MSLSLRLQGLNSQWDIKTESGTRDRHLIIEHLDDLSSAIEIYSQTALDRISYLDEDRSRGEEINFGQATSNASATSARSNLSSTRGAYDGANTTLNQMLATLQTIKGNTSG